MQYFGNYLEVFQAVKVSKQQNVYCCKCRVGVFDSKCQCGQLAAGSRKRQSKSVCFFLIKEMSNAWRYGGKARRIKKFPVGVRFSALIHTGPLAHPSFCKMDSGVSFYLGSSGWDVALTTQPHLAPRVLKQYSYTSPPLRALHGLFQDEIYPYLYLFSHREGHGAPFK